MRRVEWVCSRRRDRKDMDKDSWEEDQKPSYISSSQIIISTILATTTAERTMVLRAFSTFLQASN
jgi:hypothetical protein